MAPETAAPAATPAAVAPTPGPWTIVPWNSDDLEVQGGGRVIAHVRGGDSWFGGPGGPELARANARLIASAPAMSDCLVALRELVAHEERQAESAFSGNSNLWPGCTWREAWERALPKAFAMVERAKAAIAAAESA